MGRMKKHKLSWKPSESQLVIGYRLYWSKGTPVNYNSNFIDLGNVNEINLPDIISNNVPLGESINLGISALDESGNESDITILPEPYQLSMPSAPKGLALTTLDDYRIAEMDGKVENPAQEKQKPNAQQADELTRQESRRPETKYVTTKGSIVDDFGYDLRKALRD